MDAISIIILGIVQGITEWVPISSKTQDTIVYLKFLGGSPDLVVPILLFLHIGTVLAAIIYFRKEILQMFKTAAAKPFDKNTYTGGQIGFLITSLIFTGVVGLPLLLLEKKFFPDLNGSLLFLVMGIGLFITGFLLLKQKGKSLRTASTVGWKDGILTGALQGLSILPGVSRAGTSTTPLIWQGFDSDAAFSLSFLLSIPTVVCAELIFYLFGEGLNKLPLTDGLLLAATSFVVGYLVLDVVLRFVKKVNLAYLAFAWGAIIIAAALLGLA